MGKLEESYKASMGRPNLDDSDGEEQLIERLAREVTEVNWMTNTALQNEPFLRRREHSCKNCEIAPCAGIELTTECISSKFWLSSSMYR